MERKLIRERPVHAAGENEIKGVRGNGRMKEK